MRSHPDSAHDRNANPRTLNSRVEYLEFIVAHLQNTVDDLNEALLHQQKIADQLSRQLEIAKSALQRTMHTDYAPRSPIDDKPPHY